MFRSWWSRIFGNKQTTSRKTTLQALQCTKLEDRLTPAFNLSITGITSGVSIATVAGTTTYTATASGAQVSAIDIGNEMVAGRNVVIDTGIGSGEAGNITQLAGLGTIPNVAGTSLTFQSGADATVGNISDLGFKLNNTGTINVSAKGTTLNLELSATNVNITANVIAAGLPGATITATNLTLSATAGIGAATNGFVTQVSNLEAQTNTGGISLSNTGDVTIGGLSGSLSGLQSTSSGDIVFTNAGSISIADTTGAFDISGANVSLTANGATSDIKATVNGDVVGATGNASITAGRDILLGTAGPFDNDIETQGGISLTSGRDVIIGGDADLRCDFDGGSGGLSISAGRDITIGTGVSNSDLSSFGSGAFKWVTGAGGIFTLNTLGTVLNWGPLEIQTNVLVLVTSLSSGGTVTIHSVTANRPIDVGSTTDAAAALEISDAELDLISASTIVIGDSSAGSITVSAGISPATASTLQLVTSGAIVDGNAVGADITIANLAVRAATGIQLDTAVSTFAVRNSTSGNIEVLNTGAVTLSFVGSLDGTAGNELGNFAPGGTSTFAASSPFTYAANFTSAGSITQTTADNGAAHVDNITVNAGVLVRSTGGAIMFYAGDDIVLAATSTVQADVGEVSFRSGNADTDGSGIMTIDGNISAGSVVVLEVQVDNAGELPGVNSVAQGAASSMTSAGLLLWNFTGTPARLFDLSASATNAVGTIAAATNASISYRDSGVLVVGTVTSVVEAGATAGISTQSHAVVLQADDSISLTNDIQAGTSSVSLTSDNAAIVQSAATLIVGNSLELIAETGIGTAVDPITTTVGNLEALTTTGGIFISNTGTLNIGGVSASIEGVQATASGDIRLLNSGTLIVAGTPTEDIRAQSGNVFVQAIGAASDIEVRNDSADAIDSNNGNVTLDAGRDILLGSPTTDNFGDVEANGDITLLAGRDVIVDENTAVDAFGIGNIIATAGGNVSILATDGTQGSQFSTSGGTITVTTGVNGNFTLDAGATGSVKTINGGGNGDITINANIMVIASAIDAGSGCVILQPVTAGTEFDLGGAGGAGTIGLTDAELDFISAGILQIGNATAGPITVTGAISLAPANVPVLDLRTGASVSDAAGTLNVTSVVFNTGTSFVLTGINTIGTVAGTANTTIQLWSAGKLTIGSVVNCDGVTINGLDSNNNNIQLVVDDLEISQPLNAGTADLVIAPFAGGLINLGTEVGGSLSLTSAEIAQITAGRLQIGSAASGAITVDAAIAPAMVTHLLSGGSIGGAGSISTAELALTAGDSVSLTGANDVDNLAGSAVNDFVFTDADGLDVGSVVAIALTETGITSTTGNIGLKAGALLNLTNDVNAAGNVTLDTTSVGVTQTTGNVLAAGLELLGTGTFTLTSAANDVTTLAGNVTGAVDYRDVNSITIGTVNTVGLNTGGNPLTLQANGISQSAALAASALSISGNGNFQLGNAGNDITSFTANTTGGQVLFRDANDLTIAPGGITTGGNPLAILTGRSFTLNSGTSINLGAASGGVTAGLNDASKADKTTTVTLNGTVIAHPNNGFRIDGGIGSNTFVITPSTTTPIFIFGNLPVVAELSPAIRGDALSLQTSGLGALIGLEGFDPVNGNGAFTFTDPNNAAVEKARPVIFNSIENIKGLSMEAAAVQTAASNYQLIAAGYMNGQPFRGGFSGTLPPVAPFLIAPQFISPIGPFTAPRVSVGDIDADGLPDLIVGFGRNSGSPLVTVVKGTRIFDSSKSGQPLQTNDIMTQFYAYNPSYQGGVFVSAADLNGDGRSEIITGTGESGGPHVKIFAIDASKSANSNASVVGEFFAYASNFTGGVRVAAGDVNGDGQVDIVTAAGIGGGPHVKVFSGAGATSNPGTPSLIGEFFAYDANFHGGVFVDAGDYDRDGFADILTGAGFGGGPHVRVFDGETLSKSGAASVLNEFFDDPPSTTNPSPLQDDLSAFTAGVTGVGFGNFEDADSDLDIFVGSGIGRRTRVRIYKNGSHDPVRDGSGKPVDFLSGGTNYQFDNRRDGANIAVGGAFIS